MAGSRPRRSQQTVVSLARYQRRVHQLQQAATEAADLFRRTLAAANERTKAVEERALKAEAGLEREKQRCIQHIDSLMRILHLPAQFAEIPREKNSPLDVALALVGQRIIAITGRVHEPVLEQAKEAVQ